MVDNTLVMLGAGIIAILAIVVSSVLLVQYPKYRRIMAIPAAWLTAIILLGFIADPGAVDVVGVKAGAVDLASTGKLIRIITVLIAAMLSSVVLLRANRFSYLFKGNLGIITAYAALAMSSAVFSDLKLMSLFKGFEILVGCMTAATFYTYRDRYDVSKKVLHWLFWVYLITVVGIYVQFLIFGPQAQRQLVGETPLISFALESRFPGMKANAVGYLGALVTMFGIHIAITRSEKKSAATLGALVALLGFGVVFLSYTRSVLVFVVLASFAYLMFRKKYLLVMLGIALTILPLAIPDVRTKVEDHLRRGMSEEQLETLSGRTTMWDQVMDRDVLTIITGAGYATGSLFQNYSDNPFQRGQILAQRNVHNSIFEVIMSIGIVGAVLWLWLMLRIFVQLMQHKTRAAAREGPADRAWHLLLVAMFVMSLMRSMMNSTFVYMDYFYPLLLSYAVYADSLRPRRLEMMRSETEPLATRPV